jgi:amino acid adenylation domain-containing protein
MATHLLGALGAGDQRTAVVEPDRGRVSYAELDRLADAVAHRLARLGGPGSRMGLYLRRSTDAVAAIFGALRAGWAYVPVDPGAPAERNAEILADCAVQATIVEARFEEKFELARHGRASGTVIGIDPVGLGQAIGKWAGRDTSGDMLPIARPDGSDALACILYTSGSTGRHKGWMMSHAAVAAHAEWARGLLRPSATDVFANHAQFNFGMSLFDIFSCLTSGTPLVLVPDEVRAVAGRVIELWERERISIWFSGPAILSRIAGEAALESRDLSSLRVVAFAGEVFPARHLRELRRRLRHPRYFNFYGSTETNVAASFELAADTPGDESPPIGRPCAHFEARVVDAKGNIAGAGEAGELQLRGPGLSLGYLDQPQLTAERLVPAADGGSPWYRTCDLVRSSADGELRYAGRIGRMVKVRGYRVEPGEIEARLLEHPQVREVGVVAVEGDAELQLVAHVGGSRLPVVELKEFCSVKLPPYMIPERFVFHDVLPRNLRGKIDFDHLRLSSASERGECREPE